MNQLSSVTILLVKLAFKLIPPGLWLGTALIVALWLVVMIRMWGAAPKRRASRRSNRRQEAAG